MNNPTIKEESYRDTISLVDKGGDRNWVYPKKPKGPLYTGRTWFSILLLAFLFTGPFLSYNGHPLFLLNVLERKFIIWGIPFWPQDLPLFALLMLTFVVFIIVFTVVFGRVFCGWACPQTIFMEMLFRKIEYWIEGDYKAQQKLDKQPWDVEKAVKKIGKHAIFFAIAVLIANTFLGYLIGVNEVEKLIIDGPTAHLGKFAALIIFSTVFYFVFAKLREIACIVICPYGRLQGLMLDKNSIVVAYDFVRGEPRGFRKKGVEQQLGDCVDCHRCVQVCPTGIDIRNGTQLECINCTACIDECDDVMTKINKPKGLIRYASQAAIVNGFAKRITTRSMAYSAILVVLVSVLTYLLATRKPVEANVLRTPGMLYQQQENNQVSNMYNFEVINKTFNTQQIELQITSPVGAQLKMIDRESAQFSLGEDGLVKGSFFILLPKETIKTNNTPMEIAVLQNGKLLTTLKSNFVGPVQ
ncbi:MAG: cytochrome c oxidase accessory protein CcoG [Bacteroidia bacterium]|jgi:cytochrome c oxidase accessory protein FixG|nr:cytochrome c oxidase accessory protein CcoG [Bacteroidia bacterium]